MLVISRDGETSDSFDETFNEIVLKSTSDGFVTINGIVKESFEQIVISSGAIILIVYGFFDVPPAPPAEVEDTVVTGANTS